MKVRGRKLPPKKDTQSKRISADAYLTDPKLALAIAKRLNTMIPTPPLTVLEPSAGAGAFVVAAREVWPKARVTSIDTRAITEKQCLKAGSHRHRIGRFEDVAKTFVRSYDMALGNPPFSRAEKHIGIARGAATFVAFLLRMSFLGSQKRAKRLWSKPGLFRVIPLAERPSFIKGKGTDNSEYGIFVWKKGFTGRPVIDVHLWVNEEDSK